MHATALLHPTRRGLVLLLLVCCAAAASLAPSTAAADSIRITGKTKRSVTVLIRAQAGERCTVTVRRGTKRAKRTVRMSASSRRLKFALRGRGKARASLRCRRPFTPPAPTTPQAVPLGPYDTVVVERSSDRLYVYKGEGDRVLRQIYTADLDLPGWETNTLDVDGDYFEHVVHPFSPDFSKVLFSGVPSGLESPHIGLLDLVTGQVTDLTAPRQGSGFSDSALCEDKPGFVSQLSPRAGNGGDGVVFQSRPGTPSLSGGQCFGDGYLTRLSDPTQFTPDDYENPAVSQRVVASEDGLFRFGSPPSEQYGSSSGEGFYATDGSQYARVDCVPDSSPGNGDDNELMLGWTGPRTVALGVTELDNQITAIDWRLATLHPDGRVECTGGLPPTGREIRNLDLSFDATAILLEAEGPSGFEKYRQPLAGGEPVLADYSDAVESSTANYSVHRVGPTLP